jgi:two-component system NarL family response regulator
MGLQAILRGEPDMEVVGTASSAGEALRLLPDLEVDVLLTDLRMPDMTGIELINELVKLRPEMPVAVLSNYHSDEDVFNAVKAGAKAYILKSATMEQIFDAVRTVHGGGRWLPPLILEQVTDRLSRVELTARETEILQLIAQGLRNQEIGDKLFISKNTVRNHILNLLQKLGTTHRTEAVALAIQQGLVRLEGD